MGPSPVKDDALFNGSLGEQRGPPPFRSLLGKKSGWPQGSRGPMDHFLAYLFWEQGLLESIFLHSLNRYQFLLLIESTADGLEEKIEGKRFFNEIEGAQFHGSHGR